MREIGGGGINIVGKSRKEKAERKKSGYVDITQTLTYFQQEIYMGNIIPLESTDQKSGYAEITQTLTYFQQEIYMGNIIPLESTDQKDSNVDYIVNYFGIS